MERPTAQEWMDAIIAKSFTPVGEAYQRTFRLAPDVVFEDLLEFCGVFSPNHGATEHERGENDGRRKVGLYLLLMLQQAPLGGGGRGAVSGDQEELMIMIVAECPKCHSVNIKEFEFPKGHRMCRECGTYFKLASIQE